MTDYYHDNLIKHSLDILGSETILHSKKSVKNENILESKSSFPNEKESTDEPPQYFYDISTNLFIPPSL